MNAKSVIKKTGFFYIIDLLKHLVKAKNWLALGYLFINIYIIASIPSIFSGLFGTGETSATAVLQMLAFYTVAICVAISPIGEMLLRWQQGCTKITDIQVLNRLEPIFMEVKETVKRKHPDMMLNDKITLYIKDDGGLNAFALGRRTICVTPGLMECTDEEIKGVLGHEFGHLAMHDTDLILLITVGNFIVSAFVTILKIIIFVWQAFLSIVGLFLEKEGVFVKLLNTVIGLAKLVLVDGAMYVWTKLGVLLVMKSSRNAEYEADAFSCDLGYSEGLVSFLKKLRPMGSAKGNSLTDKLELFSLLSDSHPKTQKRIDRITSFANQSTAK